MQKKQPVKKINVPVRNKIKSLDLSTNYRVLTLEQFVQEMRAMKAKAKLTAQG